MNNLYGGSMSYKLPIDSYEWVEDLEPFYENWKDWKAESEYGYIFEVDLAYPESLHKDVAHQQFPLAPVTEEILFENLSPEAQKYVHQGYKAIKQVAHFKTRYNYVTHYENLKFYLQKGLKLLKIHSVLKFRQEAFIQPYM